ncbi:MAG: hypothetical protein L3J09_05270 [Flavobacteriaceae bacterium]|nr:hypothetical protein [Flavobacteriaceae bacterium]
MKLTLDGEIYSVTLFNANEIRLSLEEIYTEEGEDFVYTEEIRMVRQ